MPPPPPVLAPADVVAKRYLVKRELGRGGMAAVYLCHDRVTEEDVALKVLFFEQPQARRKNMIWFFQEARALAALDHAAIVRARDYGTLPDGAPYLVMDYIEGRTLHAWKHLGPLPFPLIWTIVDQILAGLGHAHARGIIHGDLKPSNVMMDPRGGEDEPKVWLLDLGLAWLLADHIDPRLHLTVPSAPAMPLGGGTAGWLAPEQIRRATPHIGPATDLYALGCCLYELLAGEEVFDGEPQEIIRAHRDKTPPPPKLLPGIPDAASGFVLRLLAKRPWHRFRFAADARKAWEAMEPAGPIRWIPPLPSSAPREDSAPPRVSPRLSSNARHLAPGIIALRPCPLVGRETERDRIAAEVRGMQAGDGPQHRMIVLSGEAGVGKSRLAEWAGELAHETGAAVPLRAKYRRVPAPLDGLRGAFLAHYNLLNQPREVIEQALMNEWEVSKNDDEGRTWVAAATAWLRPVAPNEPLDVGPTRKRFVIDKPEIARSIVRRLFERVSDGRPVLVWLDDLHVASDLTFLGLLQLTEDAQKVPLLLVATVRSEAMLTDSTVQKRIDELAAKFVGFRLGLEPLDEEDTRALLQNTLPLSDETVHAAMTRSQGNPLFSLQLVHAWASGGHLVLENGVYTVADAVKNGRAATTASIWDERVKGLDEAFHLAAFAVSALGGDIFLEPLAHLLSALGYDAGETIDVLTRAQLLLPEPGGRYRFPHGLLLEHLSERLFRYPEAHDVYRAASAALRRHPDARTERIVRLRAQNLLSALDHGEAAELILDHVAAAFPLTREASVARSLLAMLDEKVTGSHLARLHLLHAEVERRSGSPADARALAQKAREEFSRLGESENEAQAKRLLAQIACDEGVPLLAKSLIEEAYAAFELAHSDTGLADADTVAGRVAYLLGDHEGSTARLSRAAQRYRALHQPIGVAQSLLYQALAELAAGRVSAAKDTLLEARVSFEENGHALGLASVEVGLAKVAHRRGEYDEARERAEATFARFQGLSNVAGMAACARVLAMTAIDAEQPNAAEAAQRALTLTSEPHVDPWGQSEARLLLAQVALLAGDWTTARAQLRAVFALEDQVADAELLQHRGLTEAWLALGTNEPPLAIAALERARKAFPDLRRTGDHTPQLVARLLVLAKGTAAQTPLEAWNAALLGRPSRPPPPNRLDAAGE
jgi:eukaryotic-like serine/threonine-protein kinase